MLRSSRILCALVATAALIAAGCGGSSGPADGGQIDAGADPSTPTGTFGPDLVVSPAATLSFGQVPWLENAPVWTQVRTIALLNQGLAGPATDGSLKITSLTIEAAAPGTETGALTVDPAPTYDGQVGLLPRAGQNLLELTLTFTPTSLGQKKWLLKIGSNDPDQPETSVEIEADVIAPAECRYEVSPTQFALVPLSPPNARDTVVTLRNVGTAPAEACFVSKVALAEGSAPFVSLAEENVEPRVLGPGEALGIPLRLRSPGGGGEQFATLDFEIANAVPSSFSVPIRYLVDPNNCLTIAPNDLDFGRVSMGCRSLTRSVHIYNTCSSEVTIRGIRMVAAAGQPAGGPNCEGAAPCPEFKFTQSAFIPKEGLVVPPGAAPLNFSIRYEPIDTGSDTGAVAIELGEADTPLIAVVALHGKGEPTGLQTDVYTQDAVPQSDVLFVIDESPAMAIHQSSVISNLSSLFQYFLSSHADFRLGVVSADPDAGTALRTGPTHPDAFLTRTTPDAGAQFAEKIDLGTNGSVSVRCLEQAVGALTSPQNAGFVRSTAHLGILCVTATTDDSPLPVADYVADMQALHPGAPAMTSVSAIAGFDPINCPGDSGRLADAVAATNGAKENVCTPDWYKSFLPLGEFPEPPRTTFFLTSVPDLSQAPITVKVDGQILDATTSSGETVWTYDSLQNAIRFALAYLPHAGQTITVTYRTACYP